MAHQAVGRVVQVKGAVVDVEFSAEDLPEIYSAVEIPLDGKTLVLEVEQQLPNNWVRCVSMGGSAPDKAPRASSLSSTNPAGFCGSCACCSELRLAR